MRHFLTGLFIIGICGSSFAADFQSKRLVSEELAMAGNLKIVWENKLPIRAGETLKNLTVLGNQIYCLSDRNYIVSLSTKTGNVMFSRPFVAPELPIIGLELYGDELFSVVGNRLIEINPQTGAQLRSKSLAVQAACPAARNRSFFYIGGSDKLLHVIGADDKVKVFTVSAESEAAITSVIADGQRFVFSTDTGDVVAVTVDRAKRQWRFNAARAVVEPMVKDGKSLFFASKDAYVYRINIVTGKLQWKCLTEAVLEQGPSITKNMVYQHVPGKGLAAINKATGKLKWQLPKGRALLAESGGRAYVMAENGILVVMDNIKAQKLYSINISAVSRYAVNVTDRKIYIADESGRIACLEPAVRIR